MEDYRDKVAGERRGIINKLMELIPGYSGYVEKETRREADKLLREHLADRLELEKRRLEELRSEMTDAKKLDLLDDVDRVDLLFENLVDRLRFASYGYAGFFDTVRVDEDALDRLYEHDEALTNDVAGIAAKLDELRGAYDSDGDVQAKLKEMRSVLKDFETKLNERKDLISGVA
jgi:hypothetical protein